MTILHPLALLGLAAAVTPIVIYLLLRRRKTEVPWGASYLLRLTLATKRKTSIWRQVVVLAIRALLIALTALLVSRALRRNPAPAYAVPAMPDAAVHRVVLVDNSLSMTATDGAESRLTRLRGIVDALLTGQRQGDTLTVLPLLQAANPEPEPFTVRGRTRTDDRRRVHASIVPAEGRLDLGAGLAAAYARLATTPLAAARIYILSDFPRELALGQGAVEAVGTPVSGTVVVPVDLSSADGAAAPNVVLSGLTAGTDATVAGLALTVYVEARNRTDAPVDAELRVTAADDERSVDALLQPNETRRIAVSVTLDRAGPTLLEADTPQSRLTQYARLALCLDVRERLRVWIAADKDDNAAGDHISEQEFFVRALGDAVPSAEVRQVSMHELTEPIPADVDVIWIAGARYALAGAAEPLERYVRQGGGLVFSMSDAVGVDAYNENYGRLMPAPLAGRARESTDPERFSLIRTELERNASPLFEELTIRRSDLADVRVYNHMLLQEIPTDSRVVLRLTDDTAALIHRRVGRGHVYLLTTSLGIGWNSMPVRRCFIPFALRLSQAAMAGGVLPSNLAPGERLVRPWPTAGPVTMADPDGNRLAVPIAASGGEHYATVARVGGRGLYRLSDADGNTGHFTVHADPLEDDLRRLDGEARGQLAEQLGAPIHEGWAAAVRSLGGRDDWIPLAPWLLLLLLALYVFETWFVRYV